MALVVYGRTWLNRITIGSMVVSPAQTIVALPRDEVWDRIEYRPRTDTVDAFAERFEEAPGRPGAIRVIYRPVDPKVGNWIDVEVRDVSPGRRFSICALPDPRGMAGDMTSAMTLTLDDAQDGTRLAAVEVVSNIGLMDAINTWLDDILTDHLIHWRARLEGRRDWSMKRAMLKAIKPPKQARA